MRLVILSSLMLSLLAAGTGCHASGQTARATTPVTAAADCSDPSWTPPDQMKIAIGDAKTKETRTDLISSMPAPNKRQIVSGKLHAAY